ncbi:MAG: ATP-binding protein [Rhodanobacteraceae bacterium]|nr:ATP-binding protein [Rhodanobacteraceae bacterium]
MTAFAVLLAFLAGVLGAWLYLRHATTALPVAVTTAATAQALADERERIYADLHDDLGAKLLQLIHTANDPRQADLARAVLQDLRDVVTRSRGEPGTLGDVLADIRSEATQRLAAVKITLDWQDGEEIADPPLSQQQALHLFRIVREAISNTIRHAGATRLRVRVDATAQRLTLELSDDGIGRGSAGRGRGTDNMRERAKELDGNVTWRDATGHGTKVILSVALNDAAEQAA